MKAKLTEEQIDSVRGVLQILRNKTGATFHDVRTHCGLRGDDISRWPDWVKEAEGYVTEAGAAAMIFEIMESNGTDIVRFDTFGGTICPNCGKDAHGPCDVSIKAKL